MARDKLYLFGQYFKLTMAGNEPYSLECRIRLEY